MPIFQDEDDFGFGHSIKPTKRPLLNTQNLKEIHMRRASDESKTDLCEESHPENPKRSGSSSVQLIIENFIKDRHGRQSYTDSKSETASPLLPSAELKSQKLSKAAETEDSHISEIERPRSALHSGDFTQKEASKVEKESIHHEAETIDSSYLPSPASWIPTTPPQDFTPFQLDSRFPRASQRHARGPSVSSSLSSSFVLMAPTSPLVQSESNDDSTMGPLDIGAGLNNKLARRHTLQSPHSTTPPPPSAFNFSRPLPNLRRDTTFPYQAHQPRRSLASISSFQDDASAPNSPQFSKFRRPSYPSESSPLQLASMVGSYEESILRGRMSTTPSKPFDFVAKIGVLGKGKCKPHLRCPAHVTLPFPAVFYSYGTTNHGRGTNTEDGPSPYVGQIDLENGIRLRKKKGKQSAKAEDQKPSDQKIPEALLLPADEEKSTSLLAPPGGSYRIPEKGQIQIIIKNPNNTAIKLFLVPYDLAGMTSGTKTFLRQRIYSNGPVIDGPLPASPTSPKTQTRTKQLRYLIHLHICCPYKNRFYLYKTIRVVFANRVPDGQEALRSEIQFPEPRFSPWKPARESIGTAVGAGAMLAADKAFRRRSSGFPALNPTNTGALLLLEKCRNMRADREDSSTKLATGEITPSQRPYASGGTFNRETPIEPIPFSLDFKRKAVTATSSSSQISSYRSAMSEGEALSPISQESSSNRDSNSPSDSGYAYGDEQNASESLLRQRLDNLYVSSGPSWAYDFIASGPDDADDDDD